MNETLKTLKGRFSTKSYTEKQVPDALLELVLEAGLYAPSGMNTQNVISVAVREPETLKLLEKLNGAVMNSQAKTFYGAPCVIVVLADPEVGTWVENGSLVLGNLMNAAHSLGLGSCWIHRAREVFDLPEGKALLRAWGVPEHYRGVGNCILGYTAQIPAPKPRRENRIFKVD